MKFESVFDLGRKYDTIHTTTRECLVCKCFENPMSKAVDTSRVWLCERCRVALLDVVERSNENAE